MHPVVHVDESTSLLSAADGQQGGSLRGSSVYIWLVAFVSAIGGFLFGYDTGIISGAMIFVRDVFHLTSFWQELIVSVTLMTAWLFSILSANLTQKLGRKPVILGAALIFILGSLIMGLAGNKELLLVGRLIVGAGVGLASMTTPIYIAEMAPSNIRGKLVALNMTLITSGQFFSSMVAFGFSYIEDGNEWRYMLALAAIPAAIQFIIFLPMPESPRWLITNGRSSEAKEVLIKTRPKGADVTRELEAIKKGCEIKKERVCVDGVSKDESTFSRILASPPTRRALIVGCMLQMSQQVSGINTVMYYTASIFEMAGIRSKKQALLMTVAVSFTHFLFTSFTLKLVEKSGRRKLLLISLVGVSASLLVLAVGFHVAYSNSPKIISPIELGNNTHCSQYKDCTSCTQDPTCGYCYSGNINDLQHSSCLLVNPIDKTHSLFGNCTQSATQATGNVYAYEWCPSKYSYLTLLGMILYLCFFAVGLGPIPWIVNSEIYPIWARSWGQAASTSINWLFNLLISMTFLTLTQAITKQGAFYLYATCSVITLIYFFFMLPETSGRTLEDMEKVFGATTWRERINPGHADRSVRESGEEQQQEL